jgi:hypothetical protein
MRQRELRRTCRGSACIGNETQSIVVIINNFAAQNLRVKFLPRTQPFLLCVSSPIAVVTLRAPSVRFEVPQCFAAPQLFKHIAGLRLGLPGLYWGRCVDCDRSFSENYDRSGRMLVGYFVRWCNRNMRVTDQHVEFCESPYPQERRCDDSAFAEDGIR